MSQVTSDTSSTGKKLTQIYGDLGIKLYDNEGQLRSSYDILSDLANIWDTLDTNTQNYIALTSSGKILPIQGELLENGEDLRATA